MKILIVDDHPATISFMRLAFVSHGHAVTTATTVDEAIVCALAERPDVVLSDLTFDQHLDRGAGGCSLARSLRSMPGTEEVGLLAVSGADSHDIRRDAANSGFDDFVSKPVDLASLLDRVEHLGSLVAARRGRAADLS